MATKKKPKGRPSKHTLPKPLDTDMNTLAKTVLKAKPKKVWRFEQDVNQKPS